MSGPDYKSKLVLALPPALLVVLNVFLFGAATIYRGNTQEFGIDFLEVLGIYSVFALMTLFLLVGPGVLLSLKRLSIYVSVVFGVGLLLWIQGNLLVWDYGVFDGRGIDFDQGGWRGWIDGGLWCLLIVAAVAWHRKVSRVSSFASWMLMGFQGLLLLYALLSSPKTFSADSPAREFSRGLGAYSSSKNIVHFIFDGFQTDVFEEVVAENRLSDELDGFVLYRENMTVFGSTAYSIPAIFSSEIYQGDVEIARFYRTSLAEKGFHNILLERGYQVNLMPATNLPVEKYSNYFRIPSVYGTMRERDVAEAAVLMDLVLFRCLPHFLKRVVHGNQRGTVAPALAGKWKTGYFHHKEFLEDYFEGLEAVHSGPAYHFIHVSPPHPPFVTRPDCTYAGHGLEQTRDNFKIEGECVLRLLLRGIEKLKALGVYDSSTIILQADTGQGFPPGNLKNTDSDIPPATVGRSLALLAVKYPNRKGPMTVSDAQTSVVDIPATVMKAAGLPNPYRGAGLSEIDPAKDRVRSYGNRFEVKGSVYDLSSWRVVEKKPVRLPAPVYRKGAEIRFGFMGNAMPYQAGGWAGPEDGFTWTDGHRASLVLPVDGLGGPLVLQAEVKSLLVPGKVDRQRVSLMVNGRLVGERVVGPAGRLSFNIPEEFLSDPNQLKLSFELPDAASLAQFGLGNDQRLLGLAFFNLRLDAGQ